MLSESVEIFDVEEKLNRLDRSKMKIIWRGGGVFLHHQYYCDQVLIGPYPPSGQMSSPPSYLLFPDLKVKLRF